MIIRELKNPLTKEYFCLKKIIFSKEFLWHIELSTDNAGKLFFSHCVLARPEEKFRVSKSNSNYFDTVIEILNQIIEYNNLKVNCFMRINFNFSFNQGGGPNCSPHYDHDFPHKNLLVYLNQATGPTVVINSEDETQEYFYPKEDAIITFEGKHYHYQPNIGNNRVVLVATYI